MHVAQQSTTSAGEPLGESPPRREPRVAVVHDYLTQRGGAERVALSMMRAFPGARLITSLYEPTQTFAAFAEFRVETMALNRVPAFRRDPRLALPLLARAFSSHVVTDVDVVVCSSSGWAHGIAAPGAVKVVYCHSPARWLYEHEDYFADLPKAARPVARALLRPLRRWDVTAAASVDRYLVNSRLVQERLSRAYGRVAPVVWPPVAWTEGPQQPIEGLEPGFLLCVSRPRGYKNVDVVCEALERLPDERLVVVGRLPECRDGAPWSDRVRALSQLSNAQMRWLYANCDALVAASHEDFGLTPVEAYTFGRPSIVLRRGGYLDSSIDGLTGVFIENDTTDDVVDAVRRFRAATFNPEAIRGHAATFSEAAFVARLRLEVQTLLTDGSGPTEVPHVRTPAR